MVRFVSRPLCCGRVGGPDWERAIRFTQYFSILHRVERPHPAAIASDLPAARGGNFESPNANHDSKTASPLAMRGFLRNSSATVSSEDAAMCILL
jgi:hypothetical protein